MNLWAWLRKTFSNLKKIYLKFTPKTFLWHRISPSFQQRSSIRWSLSLSTPWKNVGRSGAPGTTPLESQRTTWPYQLQHSPWPEVFKTQFNAFSLRFFSQNLIFQSDKKSFQWLLCAGFAFETSWLSFGVHRSERSEPENQSCPTCQSPPAALPRLEIFRSGRPRRRPEQLWAINSVEFGAGWGQSWLLRVLINFIPKQHSDSIRKNAHLIDLWYCHMNEDRHQLIKDRRNDEDAGSLKQHELTVTKQIWRKTQCEWCKWCTDGWNPPALKENNSSRPEAYGIVT